MTHLVTALFFVAASIGATVVIHLTIREYRREILAALKGELPPRRALRPWTYRVRVAPRLRPVAAPAQPLRRAAA